MHVEKYHFKRSTIDMFVYDLKKKKFISIIYYNSMYDEGLILVMRHGNVFYSCNEQKCTNA